VTRLGVLVSGRGSNLSAIVEAQRAGRLGAEVGLVISNRPGAGGLEIAAANQVPTCLLEHGAYPSRSAFDRALVDALVAARIDLVALAGFDRLVTRTLLDAFPVRILNVHPALLPAFTGLHAQRQAIEYGVRVAGATVHYVDDQVDHGPIVLQGAVAVQPNDDEAALAARILEVEHAIFPAAIRLHAEGRLEVHGRHVRIRGSVPPPPPALLWIA
jgi:phosphoribosylglycinamide formyltransferase-1